MGRKSRHSAKTGDKSIYKSRLAASSQQGEDDSDQDPMYNEVERHYNGKQRQEEEFLQLDQEDGAIDSDEEEDDGITTKREGVFDLGIGGSSDDEEDDDSESDEEDDGKAQLNRRQAAVPTAASSSEDDDDDESESDDDDDDEVGGKSKVLNWGVKKADYYHGDTADLEIGQDVEDAYLEEEAGREVEKARLGVMEEEDFMLDDGDEARSADEDESREEEELKKSSRKQSKENKPMFTSKMDIQSIQKNKQNLRKLSQKEKLKFIQSQHPELLPILKHFRDPVEEFAKSTLVAGGALLKGLGGGSGVGKEAEVRSLRK